MSDDEFGYWAIIYVFFGLIAGVAGSAIGLIVFMRTTAVVDGFYLGMFAEWLIVTVWFVILHFPSITSYDKRDE